MRALITAMVSLAIASLVVGAPGASSAGPLGDPFYRYTGTRPLDSYAPGAVLATRTVHYNLLNTPTPVVAIQVLYRSTNARGQAVANATSVLRPQNALAGKVVAYQSAYDSLNPNDAPSRAIAGNTPLLGLTPSGRNTAVGAAVASGEVAAFAPLFALGYTIVLADTEGPTANFAAGPEYGMMTLDSLRAVRQVPATGVAATARIALLGYSGGAIATNWAAILAPEYAPDINRVLTGAAEGGVLVDPAHNLRYVNGTPVWGGVASAALVGLARAYHIPLNRYLSARGRELFAKMSDASLLNILGQYPDIRFSDLVTPPYANPNSIPEYVTVANKVNMGLAATPTIPMFIAQGSNGVLEGTPSGRRGIGPGDGVMIAGDVRALAHRYCAAGLRIQYDQYSTLSHFPAGGLWLPGALRWVVQSFTADPAPSNCGDIGAGNSLAPEIPSP